MISERVLEIRRKFLSEELENKAKQIKGILIGLDNQSVKFFKKFVEGALKGKNIKDILRGCFIAALKISGIRSMGYGRIPFTKLSSFLLFEKFLNKYTTTQLFEEFTKFTDALVEFSLFEAIKEIPTWRYWLVDGDVGMLAGIKKRKDLDGLFEKLRFSLICFPHFSPSTANMFIYFTIKCYKLWKLPYKLLRVPYFSGLIKLAQKLKLVKRKIKGSHTFSSHHYIALQELGRIVCPEDPTKLLVLEFVSRTFCKNKKCEECKLNKLCEL